MVNPIFLENNMVQLFQQSLNQQLSIQSKFFWKSFVVCSINLYYIPLAEKIAVRLSFFFLIRVTPVNNFQFHECER